MINLLPPDKRESITYARRNTRLIRWSVMLSASLLLVIAIVGAGHLYLNQAIKTNKQQLASSQEQLKVQKLEDTQKRVQEMSNSLKLVVQVLGKQVLFSKLLQQIGSAMPPNTALTNLSINKLQGGIDLQAGAIDYNSATQVQLNLKDPQNKIFSNADIVSIQCNTPSTETSPTTSDYPCTVTIRAQFAQNNPFLFINAKETAR